jgi:CBS domain-containing protein
MQLKDVMTTDGEKITPDTPLHEAARKMTDRKTTLLPVCDGTTIVGVLTMRDLMIRAIAQGRDPQTSRVRDVMLAPPIYGREDQDVAEAAELMQRWRLRRLPVLNQQMHVVGIVSLRALQRNVVGVNRRRPGKIAKRRTRVRRTRQSAI